MGAGGFVRKIFGGGGGGGIAPDPNAEAPPMLRRLPRQRLPEKGLKKREPDSRQSWNVSVSSLRRPLKEPGRRRYTRIKSSRSVSPLQLRIPPRRIAAPPLWRRNANTAEGTLPVSRVTWARTVRLRQLLAQGLAAPEGICNGGRTRNRGRTSFRRPVFRVFHDAGECRGRGR